MKRLWITLFFMSVALLFINGTSWAGNEINVTRVIFVDYDGDGFDDLAADSDDDGIPDCIERSQKESTIELISVLGSTFDAAGDNSDLYLNNKEAFGAKDFSIRFMSSRRIGLNTSEGFGPGTGLGVSASGGCVGGVCH
ncbi:MAG: hypothetical protein KAR42_12725 [candidate division Zixibacteria bacterium]|nr:hypothetical protein [candidate division Zixibacteria bacterium]